jgi:hypothetical protein
MEGHCSTGKSPQRAVAPIEEEEDLDVFWSPLTTVPNVHLVSSSKRLLLCDVLGRRVVFVICLSTEVPLFAARAWSMNSIKPHHKEYL